MSISESAVIWCAKACWSRVWSPLMHWAASTCAAQASELSAGCSACLSGATHVCTTTALTRALGQTRAHLLRSCMAEKACESLLQAAVTWPVPVMRTQRASQTCALKIVRSLPACAEGYAWL